MEDVQKQLEAVELKEKHLIKMSEEFKSKMMDGLPQEELIKRFRVDIDKYREELEKGSISFEDKQRTIRTFVKEVRVNMNGRKARRPSLVETIPVRKEIEPISLMDSKIVTVYSRDNNSNDGWGLQPDYSSNFADVIYHFPFPPKDFGVTVNSLLQ